MRGIKIQKTKEANAERGEREREYGDVNGARSRLRIPQKRNK